MVKSNKGGKGDTKKEKVTKDPKKAKDVKGKKKDKKKEQKKKAIKAIVDVLPLENVEPEEPEVVEEEEEDIREPCVQEAAIHLRYQNRVKTKTDSELELEKEMAKQQHIVTDEARLERAGRLRQMHRVIMNTAAYMLQTSLKNVEEGVLDADSHVKLLCSLLEDGGRHAVVFTYNTNNYHDVDPVTDEVHTYKKKTIIVSDGSNRFEDHVIIVTRARNNFNADNKTIAEEYLFSGFPLGDEGSTVLTGLSSLFGQVTRDQINSLTNWQSLTQTKAGLRLTRYFKEDINDFSNYLNSTKTALNSLVKFSYPEDLISVYIGTPELVTETVGDNESIAHVENIALAWFDTIERTLTDCEKLIGEKGEPKPDSALDHCRMYIAKYCSMFDFMQSEVLKKTIALLKQVRSHLLPRWSNLETRVIVNRISVMDQLKYLNAARQYWAPLSRCHPSSVSNYLNALLYSFRQLKASSKTMVSPQKMTAILLKITNSLLSNCLRYLTDDRRRTIWQQRSKRLLQKFDVCLRLHKEWHLAYEKMMEDIDNCPDERQFGCSSVQIFGKFDSFKIRILKLKDFLLKRLKYGVLALSPMEGIEEHTVRFNKIFAIIPGRDYDALEHRDHRFNKDYDDFLTSIADAEQKLKAFMFSKLADLPNSETLLNTLQRFEKLKLDALCYDEAYSNILKLFMFELEELRDTYNFERSKVISSMFAPPMSARVIWIRGLAQLIRRPMAFFEGKECLDTSPIAQKVIKHYNALLTTFIHYEHVFHHEWLHQFGYIEELLAQPLLFQVDTKEKMIINFDNRILLTFIEVNCFLTLKLSINDLATLYYSLKSEVVRRYTKVKILLDSYKKLKSSVPSLFVNLMQPYMSTIEKVFEPCFSLVTWSSLNFDDFIANIETTLDNAGSFIKEVNDLREARIEEPLDTLSKTMLVYIHPSNLDHNEYLKRNIYFQKKMTRRILVMSRNIETASINLINKFVDVTHTPTIDERDKLTWLNPDKVNIKSGSHIDLSTDRHQSEDIRVRAGIATTRTFKDDCMEVFNYFHEKFVCCLVKSMVYTLIRLRNRTSTSMGKVNRRPMLVSSINLEIPKIVEKPTLYEVQTIVNKVVAGALFITQALDPWASIGNPSFRELAVVEYDPNEVKATQTITFVGNPEYENMNTDEMEKLELPNLAMVEGDVDSRGFPIITYFKAVAQHKEVMRHITALQDIFSVIAQDVEKLTQKYYKFKDLWEEDISEYVEGLVSSDPFPPKIRSRFEYYKDAATEIETMPNEVIIGALEFNLKPLKQTLSSECKVWLDLLGKKFGSLYHQKLTYFMNFINDHLAQLNRTVNDLDDCRLVMQCMEEIRDTFVDMNWEVNKFEEVFFIFHQFKVATVPGDSEVVDGLRFNYGNLLKSSVSMQEILCTLQKQLKRELLDGIAGFKASVDAYDIDYEEHGPMVSGLAAKEASDRVLLFQDRFEILWRKFEIYSSGERLFGMAVTDYPTLVERKKQFNLLQKLYGLYLLVNKTIDGYFEIPWYKINVEVITTEINDFLGRCRKLPKGMKDWPAFIELSKKLNDFNDSCPLIEMMANKAMKPRHWMRLEKLLNCKFDIESDDFTLQNVMEAPLLKYKDDVEDICVGAVKEKDIESKLNQVIADWAIVDLQFSTFKNKGEVLLKGQETSEVISLLEDSLMVLASLATNRFNTFFKKDIMTWIYNLSTTGEILENWLIVQNLWIYLEAVFVGGDIAKQLPGEAKRFAGIDKSWLKIMQRARELVNVINVCVGDDTMKTILPFLLEQLEACQKSLTGYLEQKRLIFPRFFFVSDPALLEILGQASDPRTIQAHLLGVFENVAQVEFFEKEKITKIISREGETIVLEKIVHCIGGVEFWLGALLDSAKHALGLIISQAWEFINDEEFKVMAMIARYPSQVGLLGLQMLWTRDSEKAMRDAHEDSKIMKKTNRYFLIILNALIDMTAKNLSKFERIKFETLIIIHVHQRDIFEDLFLKKIQNPEDFEWLKQERFYFDEDNDRCLVKITDVDFIYQNEFMGCTDRLVITPLTDRCYITLAQSIWMSMGGAPAGPAGTGKTETTKDMGKSLGKYVVVFNCSDQMDFRGLGRIFKGLAQSGSWGCFDEFNRIELPVLSVAAQQISIIFTARREKKMTFIFSDGDTVSLNYEFGFFITMNPGYAGRQELPENLKIMFRSVAMMVPDRHIIIRVKLASCGYRENIVLSRKFFILYRLCEEQLSKQVHYDFGLRNILSVLRTLGAQKRANPKDSEETVLMRVLRDMNVSKLVDEDEPLFVTLVEDLFVGLKLTTSVYKELQSGIRKACAEYYLTNHPPWNLKVVQLYETSLVRHGLMTMGPTGSGKSSCMNALLYAFTDSGKPHREMRMNPKSITAPQMFGRLDAATNDWTDGIFSTLWRRSLKVKKSDFVWIVLDGPVDAVWIENLNSVLDDNKTLTLANGDRIVMAPNAKLVFEPDNVDNASPATVSRMGMVFLSSSVLNWDPILDAWCLRRKPREVEVLRPLFHKIYEDAYTCVETKLIAKMRILEALYIRQCLDVLTGLIDVNQPSYEGQEEEEEDLEPAIELSPLHLEKYFLFSMMWSLGSVLELDQRLKLQNFLLEHPSKLAWPILSDESETIFEFFVTNEGEWNHWNKRVEEFIYPSDEVPDYASILVPNVDNVRTQFLIETIAKQGKGVLLIGEQGTAKTVMIKGFVGKFNPEYHLSKSLNFSSATTPNMVQRIIESYLDKRIGTTFGPPNNRHMSIFIDDINMPVINAWGDQVTNEIVRQLMEQGGFYSLDKPGEFSTVVDIQFLAAMIHPGGGRNDIPPRLKRQFNIFNCTLPSDKSMDKIFSVIGEGYFCKERFKEEIVQTIPLLVPLTRTLWQKTKVKMLPTPAKFHYVFNLRDLSRIWEGILYIKDEEVPGITTLLKLWKHECLRVISDRFTNEEDKKWFNKTIVETVNEVLPVSISPLFDPSETYFVDFLREPPEPTGDEPEDFAFEAPKIYEEIPSWEFVLEKLAAYTVGYNEMVRGQPMDLVFFKDCMIHLIKVSRVIRTPIGSIMLVGVGGSGKRSITYMASYIANYSTFQITLTRIYSVSNFMDDLKYLYRIAGGKNKGISFIFTDNDIKDEAFLEFLNNILSAGEVANLFAKDEMDEILNEIIPEMRRCQPKKIPTLDNLYDFFISTSRKNLHLVLCFSPVSEKFRSRSMKFPGLISGCTIDWFSRWPKDALIAVANHFIQNFPIVCDQPTKSRLINLMGDIHDDIADRCISYYDRYRRQTYVTPKSFLSFLQGYKDIYAQKNSEIDVLTVQMTTGLKKLEEAAESVNVLKIELVEKEKEITVANAKTDIVLAEVRVKTEQAEVVKAEVKGVADKAGELVKFIEKDKIFAENKLELARPALEAAEAALQTITASDIATVRKLGKPPYLITLIMDCVQILFQKRLIPVKPDPERNFLFTNWEGSLKVMADTRFLFNLQNFPKDSINGEMIDLLQPYFNYPLYTFANAKQACGNVAGLLQWTIAMQDFYGVNKEVLPLKANLAIQQFKLGTAQKELKDARAVLKAREDELAQVNLLLGNALREKKIVQDIADKCQARMDAATALLGGLSGEQTRWTEQLFQFKAETERLIGDVLLLTGFLSYLGPFNQEFRNSVQAAWNRRIARLKIPLTDGLNIVESLVDAATIGEWNLDGLPNDELSIQNGIITTKAMRYPLLIDPQSQGVFWIKNKEKANQLVVTSLNHKYFRQHLEDTLSLGTPLLIEDVLEDLDPVLDNVLEKNFIKVGTSLKVKLSDKEVDVTKSFRLYITTKLSNPMYTPEIYARTNIIDFTVTMKGLEDQLLGRVILTEKKELENERTALLADVTANKRKMKELEANLLLKLTTVKGSLVDDESVLQVLNVTKDTATSVRLKLKNAATTEIKINTAREEFRPVAARGSVLYFLVVDMSLVDYMYQTSLVQFLERFDYSLDMSEKHQVTGRRIGAIIDYLTFEIFRYKTRGLYEKHKYLFTLLLALKIDLQMGRITHPEFENFVKGGGSLNLNNVAPKPQFRWLTDLSWLNLVQLSSLPAFNLVLEQIQQNEKSWRYWFEKPAPEEETFPEDYEKYDVFKKLLLIRAMFPDRILSQSKRYIAGSLGERFASPVLLNVPVMLAESRPSTPMICFLSMGSDPTPTIEVLAKRKEIPLGQISMGQGQEIHARKLMALSMSEGGWVLLQNCHLGLDYMSEMFLVLMDPEAKIDPDFRVWITTEPHPLFPINLLQICIKFTFEPPQGLAAGLMRTYSAMTQDFLDFSNDPHYLPLIYGISFLHSVVQERRKFGPLGWNIPYEFNFADWYASTLFVQNHLEALEKGQPVSWITLKYMISEVQYGGRVTDDFDKRLLVTLTKVWFNEHFIQPDFMFYRGYKVLKFRYIQQYLDAVGDLPSSDPPQALGLHPNANITYQASTATDVLETIISIQPKEASAGGGETRESVVAKQTLEMLSKMPLDYDPFEVKERLKIMGILNSMNIFLRQELDRMQKVVSLVRKTLKDLLLAIEGTIIMNEALRDALDNIYDARVPNLWKRGSWQSSSIGFWFTELLDRAIQFNQWIFKGRPPQFWMTGFFNPQGFLTAMRQEIARAHKGWSLETVVLFNNVTKLTKEQIRVPPSEGVFVYGLYLEGAGWDRKSDKLTESAMKVLYLLLPVVHIYAINAALPTGNYVCPVYKRPTRTDLNFITSLFLPCKMTPEHWCMRGVAILCDIK